MTQIIDRLILLQYSQKSSNRLTEIIANYLQWLLHLTHRKLPVSCVMFMLIMWIIME